MSDNLAPLLSVQGVTLRFGGVVALDDVTFDVMPGQIAGLIGPNGAGKTTLFNCLSRLYQPSAGEILFENRSVLSVPRQLPQPPREHLWARCPPFPGRMLRFEWPTRPRWSLFQDTDLPSPKRSTKRARLRI